MLEIRDDMSYVTCQSSVLKKWGQWAAVILAQSSFSLDFLRKDVICEKSVCKVSETIWKLFDCTIFFLQLTSETVMWNFSGRKSLPRMLKNYFLRKLLQKVLQVEKVAFRIETQTLL